AGSDGCVPPAAPARAAPGSGKARTVALQPQARDPFSNLVAGIGGAAARDMQPFQDRRTGGGIGQTVQAAAKPAAAGGAEGYQRLASPVIAFEEGVNHHR